MAGTSETAPAHTRFLAQAQQYNGFIDFCLQNSGFSANSSDSAHCKYSQLLASESLDWASLVEQYNETADTQIDLDEFVAWTGEIKASEGTSNEALGAPLTCPFFQRKPEAAPVDFAALQRQLLASAHVRFIDLDELLGDAPSISEAHLVALTEQVDQAISSRSGAIVICRFSEIGYFASTLPSELTAVKVDRFFLPPLSSDPASRANITKLSLRLQKKIAAFAHSSRTPIYAIASNKIAFSAFPILFAVPNVIATENFAIHFASGTPPATAATTGTSAAAASALTRYSPYLDRLAFPCAGLLSWAKIKLDMLVPYTTRTPQFNPHDPTSPPAAMPRSPASTGPPKTGATQQPNPELTVATANFIMNNPNFVLRAPEAIDLGLAIAIVPARQIVAMLEILTTAAKCPPPHTANAIFASIDKLFEYPGPSKITTWKPEISYFFKDCSSSEKIVDELTTSGKNWASNYLTGMLSENPSVSQKFHELLLRATSIYSTQIAPSTRIKDRDTVEAAFDQITDLELEALN